MFAHSTVRDCAADVFLSSSRFGKEMPSGQHGYKFHVVQFSIFFEMNQSVTICSVTGILLTEMIFCIDENRNGDTFFVA